MMPDQVKLKETKQEDLMEAFPDGKNGLPVHVRHNPSYSGNMKIEIRKKV